MSIENELPQEQEQQEQEAEHERQQQQQQQQQQHDIYHDMKNTGDDNNDGDEEEDEEEVQRRLRQEEEEAMERMLLAQEAEQEELERQQQEEMNRQQLQENEQHEQALQPQERHDDAFGGDDPALGVVAQEAEAAPLQGREAEAAAVAAAAAPPPLLFHGNHHHHHHHNNTYYYYMDALSNYYNPMKRLSYIQSSFLAACLLVLYALRTREQWYLALVYISSSKWSYVVLGNALIAFCVGIFQAITGTCLGGLRLHETEGLSDFFRWNVTETCLALTMFRAELTIGTGIYFLLLILAKCLHWVADLREGHLRMTEEAIIVLENPNIIQNNIHNHDNNQNSDDNQNDHDNANLADNDEAATTTTTIGNFFHGWPMIQKPHWKLLLLLVGLLLLDILAVKCCGQDILNHGPSVFILFAFESAILLVSAWNNIILWNLHVLDGFIHYLHDHTPSHSIGHKWIHPWKEHKATCMFAVELQAQATKFLCYVTFFAIVLTYYGMPINLFREVYLSFQSFKQRLVAFAKYRKLMASMNKFPSLESDEQLDEAGRTCIICRDEMSLSDSKQLPGCRHVFHKSCLREWLVQQQSCPTCRGDITALQREENVRAARAAQQQEAEQQDDQQQQQQHQQEEQQTQPVTHENNMNLQNDDNNKDKDNDNEEENSHSPNDFATSKANITSTDSSSSASLQKQQEQQPQQEQTTTQTSQTANNGKPGTFSMFPGLYTVKENGAQVWNTYDMFEPSATVIRTIPGGVMVICFGEEKIHYEMMEEPIAMLKIPDGYIRQEDASFVLNVTNSMRAPSLPPTQAAKPPSTMTT